LKDKRRERKKMSEKSEGMKEIEKRVQHEIEVRTEAESVKLKTLAEIVAEQKTKPPKHVLVPSLECDISYRDLTVGDYVELVKPREDKMSLVIEILLRTWGKADATVTNESLTRLGLPTCLEIANLMGYGVSAIPLVRNASKPSKPPQNPPPANSS